MLKNPFCFFCVQSRRNFTTDISKSCRVFTGIEPATAGSNLSRVITELNMLPHFFNYLMRLFCIPYFAVCEFYLKAYLYSLPYGNRDIEIRFLLYIRLLCDFYLALKQLYNKNAQFNMTNQICFILFLCVCVCLTD